MDQEVGLEDLGEIGYQAHQMLVVMEEITDLEDQLKAKKEELRRISEGTIPELMMARNLTEVKLGNGAKLKVEKYYSAKIPDAMRNDAFQYLEDTGNDSIIKSEIKAAFGKGEREREEEAVRALEEKGVPFSRKVGIHPMTLKAFVREQIEAGEDLPRDAFGVYEGYKTKVKV